jgi:broad specificity phosphatase PhoE
LSQLGFEQAQATADRLASWSIDRVVSSPLKRAAETARVIAAPHGLVIEPEPALMEYDVGRVSGLTGAQIRERHPEVLSAYARGERPRFPGEEGRVAFVRRITAALNQLRGQDETIAAVVHGGVISALCAQLLGLDATRPAVFQVANCSLTEVVTDRRGQLVLVRHNDVCHLHGLVTMVDRG